jgi:hypothetical protein
MFKNTDHSYYNEPSSESYEVGDDDDVYNLCIKDTQINILLSNVKAYLCPECWMNYIKGFQILLIPVKQMDYH